MAAEDYLRARTLRMLRKVEWSDDDACPECSEVSGTYAAHAPGCEMAALIDE